jgi:fructokinase
VHAIDMGMAEILVVGEALVDVVRRPDGSTVEYAGGSAANVAVALARLGRPVELLTAFGDDQRGAVLARHLNQSAVGMTGDPHRLERTSTALATLAADGSASYTFDIEWRLGEIPEVTPRVVHTCSLGAVLAPGAEEVRRLLERLRPAALVTYDVNARPAVTGAGPDVLCAVEGVAALADLVKASDEDLLLLYPAATVEQAVARLRDLGPSAVVVTRGGSGATWFGSDGRVDVPAAEVDVADTIGAGDTFGAAVIDGLCELDAVGGRLPNLGSSEVEGLLRHAARAAAVTVSRPGADPPYRHELL